MPSTPSKFNLPKQEVRVQFSHPTSSTRLKDLAETVTDYSNGTTESTTCAEMMEFDHHYDMNLAQNESPTKKQLRIQIPEKPTKQQQRRLKHAVLQQSQPQQQQTEVIQVKHDATMVRNLFLMGFFCPLLWFYVWNKYKKEQEWEKDTQQYIYASKIMGIVSIITFFAALFVFAIFGFLLLFSR